MEIAFVAIDQVTPSYLLTARTEWHQALNLTRFTADLHIDTKVVFIVSVAPERELT